MIQTEGMLLHGHSHNLDHQPAVWDAKHNSVVPL